MMRVDPKILLSIGRKRRKFASYLHLEGIGAAADVLRGEARVLQVMWDIPFVSRRTSFTLRCEHAWLLCRLLTSQKGLFQFVTDHAGDP